MSSLSSPGIGSGLDVNSIVSQLVSIERQPIVALQTKAAAIQTQLSSYGLLSSYAGNMHDIAAQMASPTFWAQNAATSSDSSSVSVTATTTAASGSYAVQVSQLAQAQTIASKAYTDSSTTVGTGTLHIDFGAWDTGLTTFTADGSKTGIDISIGAGENTLSGIKAKINAANAGVTASIVTDASGARLVINSNSTGAKSAVRITVADDDGNNTDANGLSALAFNPATSSGQMTQAQAAKDAQATINGLAVTSSTNTLSGAIDGVTLTLSKVTTSPATVGVSLNTAALTSAITSFAKAYSDMNGYITTQTKYDATSQKAAALQGDQSTLTLRSNLRSVYLSSSSASPMYSSLSAIGVQVQADGSLKVDNTKLSAALANPTEVAKLFSNNSADPAQQGFAVRAQALADQMTGSNGSITTHVKALQDSIKRNANDQQTLQDRVALTQTRLMKQYTALDTLLGQTSGIASSLSQALTGLANVNTSIANNK